MTKRGFLFIAIANFVLGVGVGIFSTWYCEGEIIWWICFVAGLGTALLGFWIASTASIITYESRS